MTQSGERREDSMSAVQLTDDESTHGTQLDEEYELRPLNKEQDLTRKSPPLLPSYSKCLTYLTLDESLHKRYGTDEDVKARRTERLKKQEKKNLTVSFDKVIIREYPICLGNNPAVSRGPPISIDWEPMTHLEFDFVEFHEYKFPPRGQAEMFVPKFIREKILMEAGYSRRDLKKMIKDVNISRLQRKNTIANLKFQKLHLGWENTKDTLRRFACFRSTPTSIDWKEIEIGSTSKSVLLDGTADANDNVKDTKKD